MRSGKNRRDHTTGLPRWPSMVGTAISAPLSGSSAPISRSIMAASTCGMSPRQTMAPSASAGSAAMPALSEVPSPSAKCRIVHELDRQAGERRLDALALMAGDHDHRPRPRSERRFGDDAHQRPAADLGQKLVRARPCGSSGRRRAPARRRCGPACTGSSRGCGRVTISISRPPTPMPVMSSRGTGRPARSRISTQSKPFSLG